MVSDTGEVTGTLSFSNARITTSVPIKKVDDKGNPLAGATIVVLDAKQKHRSFAVSVSVFFLIFQEPDNVSQEYR